MKLEEIEFFKNVANFLSKTVVIFVEEKTLEFFDRIKGMIPKEALISDVRYEGSDVAVYIKNRKMFGEDSSFVKEIVSALKKRILLRPDPSICINPEKAEEIIKSLIPMDAGLKEIYFEPEFGSVILEVEKPGVAIGKGGDILREIKKQTCWSPDIKRIPAIPSEVVKTLREILYKESVFRKDFLDRVGKRIHSGWKGTEWIRFTTLGGYREVGRSCTLLQTPESKVLLDCGLKVGTNEFPYLSVPEFNIQSLDAVILSHSHLDHCGLIPYLYEYGFEGPLYCTAPTRDLMVLLCLDFIEIAQREGKTPLYSSKGVKEAVKHAVILEYGEVSDITPDMRLTLVNAGHLLGSSIVHVHIANGMHNVAYTGDLKFDRTALFEPASADFARVETFITESTYGGGEDIQPSRQIAESSLVKSIQRVMERRGKVLIPAFAVERAQDVMAILAENGFDYPVYLDGMLWDASAIYTAYPEYLSREIQQLIFREGFNPFTAKIFKRVGSAAERNAVIESAEPCVVIATSGMLSGGPVMEHMKYLAESEKNMLMFVGYQAEGTLGRKIQKGWKEIPISENGKTASLPIKMEVATIEGLSGHSDHKQLINYIYRLRQNPERIVCCHGDNAKCIELARELHRIFKCETIAPKLLETVRLR